MRVGPQGFGVNRHKRLLILAGTFFTPAPLRLSVPRIFGLCDRTRSCVLAIFFGSDTSPDPDPTVMNAPRPAILSFLRSVIVALMCGGAVGSVQADPVVSNLTASQRAGTKLVDITYDLDAPGFGAVAVTLEASSDGGATWTVPVASATGGGRDAWNGDRHGSPDSPSQRKGQRGGRPPWNASKTEPSERRNLDQFGRFRDRGKLFLPKIGEKPPGDNELPYP